MRDDQIKYMVNRFLGWRLPERFSPDAGITFKADYNENTAYPMKHEPMGTNLFDATQAEAMIRYLVDGMPDTPGGIPSEAPENSKPGLCEGCPPAHCGDTPTRCLPCPRRTNPMSEADYQRWLATGMRFPERFMRKATP